MDKLSSLRSCTSTQQLSGNGLSPHFRLMALLSVTPHWLSDISLFKSPKLVSKPLQCVEGTLSVLDAKFLLPQNIFTGKFRTSYLFEINTPVPCKSAKVCTRVMSEFVQLINFHLS